MADRSMRVTQLSHVCLCVRDVARSACFYHNLFGMEVGPVDPPSERMCRCYVSAGDGSGEFGLVLKQGYPAGAQGCGVDHFSFEVPALADVFETYRAARTLGTQATEPRRYDGYWQTFVFDPDGYKIEVLTREVPAVAEAESPGSEACAAGRE